MPNKKLLIGLVVALLILLLSILYRNNRDNQLEASFEEVFARNVEMRD